MTEINGTAQFDEQGRAQFDEQGRWISRRDRAAPKSTRKSESATNTCESPASIYARRRDQVQIARGSAVSNPTVAAEAAKPRAPVAAEIYAARARCVADARSRLAGESGQ
jgi:hypothetical protein